MKFARLVRFCPGVSRWFTVYYCQNISTVEKRVKDLQDTVCHLMVVIIDNVTSNEIDSDEVIVKVAMGFERDIKDLLGYAQAFVICIMNLVANYVIEL